MLIWPKIRFLTTIRLPQDCHNKIPVHLRDVDIEKVLVSNKISFGKRNYKYFIGYLYNNYKIKPLHIVLSKTSAYIKSYDRQTKWMYFMIEDVDLLKKIW